MAIKKDRKTKKSSSLRLKIIVMMTILVFLQSLALITALFSSRVFFALDEEAFRIFQNTIEARAVEFNQISGKLSANVALESNGWRQLGASNLSYEQMGELAADSVFNLLNNNQITGAFVVFHKSLTVDYPNEDLVIYIRDTAPGFSITSDYARFQVERGPAFISREYQVALSANWDIHMDYLGDYYSMPLMALAKEPGNTILDYGYWSPPHDPLGDGRQVITYSVPLLDSQEVVLGILGVEMSSSYFAQHYLPNQEIPYHNSFYALVGDIDHQLDLGWLIPGGPVARQYLQKGSKLPLINSGSSGSLKTQLGNLGDVYCSMESLHLYNDFSFFTNENWNLVGFVPEKVLRTTSFSIRRRLFGSILVTTIIALNAVVALAYFSTRKIFSLSQNIRDMNQYEEIHFQPTGLREIDTLTAEVEKLNKSIIENAGITRKIMDLTQMPIGCFEINHDNPYVTVTGYISRLLSLPENELITQNQWWQYYAQITARHSMDENIFLFRQRWLKINEADTARGLVGIIVDVTEDIEERHRLQQELKHDSLTGLINRQTFRERVSALIKAHPQDIGALVFIDLDNLKYVNDLYGHDLGDQYLMRAGRVIRDFAAGKGIVSRISGDEFAIYLPGFANQKDLREFIWQQFKKHENKVFLLPDGEEQVIRYSGGIAWYPNDADNLADLLRLADFAMYEAKHQRKGTLKEFDPISYQQNLYLLTNREAINKLIDEQLVTFAFQPIIEVETGEIYGYEALMRPLYKNFNSPLEVLRVAGTQFKLYQLEHMLIFKAMQLVADFKSKLGTKKIFINSIPNEFLSPEDINRLQEKYGEFFSQIVIEFIESEILTPQMIEKKVATMRKLGFAIAIDDFGAGFSNEMQVLSLNPEIIKIDMGIIRNIDQDERKKLFLSNILSFCQVQGIKVVAEGVETEAEFFYLVEQKVDFIQGFLLARPSFEISEVNQYYQRFLRQRR